MKLGLVIALAWPVTACGAADGVCLLGSGS
jgi:hypothetical protein